MTGVVADRYAILAPLGEGGVANVFLAADRVDGRRVALKFFPPMRSSTEEFRREASATVPTRHPGLVRLVDAGVHEGAPWLAIEHVDGKDLREQLRAGAVPPGQVLDWMAQVFDALDALHRVGLVHGDIKPENVIREGDRLRVVDFGRARLRFLYGAGGAFPGTAPYMHPDLFAGGAATPATDCFAAWVMAYELVAARRPFAVTDLRAAKPMSIPAFSPLADEALDVLVGAGLRGELDSARRSWVAIARYCRGCRDPMPSAALPALPPPSLARIARARVASGHDLAL
ncbi:MAG: serine/threonine protein kinase, partial [Deltaproteobacteria bacterium]|nr:serine/threonine protein kinase [Deltaproteobacteria bacterium]